MPAASNPAGEATVARRLATLGPDRAETQQQLGLAIAPHGLADALRPLRRVTWLAPHAVHAHLNLAIALFGLRRHAEAGSAFRRMLVLAPGHPDALYGTGIVDGESGTPEQAILRLRRAAGLRPDHVETLVRLANALVRMRRNREAATLERRALALAPARAAALFDLGVAFSELEQHRAAITCSLRALALEPWSVQAEINISASLLVLGRTAEALERLRRTAYRADAGPEPFRNLLAALLYSSAVGEEERWTVARAFEARHAAAPDRRPFATARDPERRLTVGYLSSDLYDHAIARALAPVVAAHDRDRFKIVGFSVGINVNDRTEQLRQLMAGWHQVAHLSDAEIAALVRKEQVDILVVVGGRFDRNRPLVASYRAAPVQISIHDGGTSGLATMDYLIADRILVAARNRRSERFTERVLRLPSFYAHAPMMHAPEVAAPPSQATGRITFGCFNNPAKISGETLRLWSAVLSAVPGSRLMLKYMRHYDDPDVRRRALGMGIDPGRVTFHAVTDGAVDHLRSYAEIDIALDSCPFTGSTTTWEALWMGVPVVTLLGDTIVARTSASFLKPLKLDGLIAETPEDFVRIARELAGDPAQLAVLRASLRHRVAKSPLCDGVRRARQFERLYRAAWRRWCRSG